MRLRHSEMVFAVAVARDGIVASGTWSDDEKPHSVLLWDPRHAGPPCGALCFCVVSLCILCAAFHERCTTAAPCAVLAGHKSSVWCVAFSGNGAAIASCSSDQTARLWTRR